MKHKCKRCGYETDRISSLKNHLKRENPCRDCLLCNLSVKDLLKALDKDTTDYGYQCNECGKKYKSKSGFYSHKKSCQILKLANENDILKIELSKAQSQISNNIQTNIIQNQTNIQTQNNNTINIVINALGHENTSYITNEFMLDCVIKKVDGLIDFVKKKHFDPEHPENHNIKIDDDVYTLLEIPQLCKSPHIIERMPAKDNNFWIKLKDIYALEDNIMVRVETAFKKFFQEYPIENIQKKIIEEFIKDIVLPMDWSMNLDEEDDFDNPDGEEIKKDIINKIKANIVDHYKKLISVT